MPEVVVARPQLRHAQPPGRERVAHVLPLGAELELDRAGRRLLAVQRRRDVEPEAPALPRRERDRVAHVRAVGRAALGQDHLRARAAVTVGREDELVAALVEADGRGRRERTGVQRVAEREVVLLDGDDVREVGLDHELELERDRLGALVADGDVVLHPFADEALAHDREHVLAEAARERVPQVEGGGEVLDPAGREQQRPLAVHAQLEPGEEARVVREQPGRGAVEVADVVADAERRPFEDGERHVSRMIRAPDVCASAITTISSTFTFGGLVSAKTTQSAMSSGCIGPPRATSS